MKKTLALLLSFVIVLGMMVGCTSTASSSQPAAPSAAEEATSQASSAGEEAPAANFDVLNVGIMPYIGSVPCHYADIQGYFEAAGLNVNLITFATGAPMNEAFAAGQIDIAVIGLAGVITMSTGTATCILETNTASGGNGIYVRPDSPIAGVQGEVEGRPTLYGSAETVKGLTVIGQLGTSSQLNTIAYLEHFGLTEDDISFVNMDSGTDLQAFMSGEGDAVALAVPYSYQAEAEGYICAASFEDSTSIMVPDVMLAKNEIVETRRDELALFVKAYLQATDELNADYDLLFDTAKTFYTENGREYSDENLTADFACRELIDAGYMSQEDYVYGRGMWQVAQFFVESGKIEPDNLQNVIASLDTSFIEEVTGVGVVTETGTE